MVGTPYLWILTVSTLLDLVVGLAIVWKLRRQPTGLGSAGTSLIHAEGLLTAVLGAGASLLIKVAVLKPWGLLSFGMVHLTFLFCALTLPVLGVCLLLASILPGNRRNTLLSGPAQTLAALLMLGAPISGYATFIEPFRLQLEQATLELPTERLGTQPIRIGVLSDLQAAHVGEYEQTAITRLLEQQPDLILIPGDFHQMEDDVFELELPALRALLGRLQAPGGVFFVSGDTDTTEERAPRLLAGTSIQWIDDAVTTVQIGDRRVTLGGLGLDFASDSAKRVITALETTSDPTDVRILMSHRPDTVLNLKPGSRVDLVVAGHTHGGQIVIPGFGPLMTLSDVPRAVAAGGLHRVSGNAIYVSRGVGCERAQAPRIRLFCPPEISLLTLGTPPVSRTANSPPDTTGRGIRSF